MNNKNLYKKLLDKFGAGYSDYDAKIAGAFGAGNLDEAMHLSHTMKGLAGNLGAENLQEASLTLEMIAKSGQDRLRELDGAVEKFTVELKRALKEVADGVDMG